MNVVVRQAKPEDARQMVLRMQELAAEPRGMLRASAEIPTYTDEQTRWMTQRERERIAGFCASNNSLLLVAEVDGQIAGVLDLETGASGSGVEAVGLGMFVGKDWRDRGIASELLRSAIEWARGACQINRIVLNVETRNEAAISLYRKHGFQIQGRPFSPADFPGAELVRMVLRM